MANTLRFKRGLAAGLPASVAGEPLFTTDTFDLYIGTGAANQRFQKYIASGTTLQYLRGDGSLATFPTNIVTGTGVAGQVAYWSGANTQGGSNNLFWDATNGRLGIGTNTPATPLDILGTLGSFRVFGSGAEVSFTRDANNSISATGGTSAQLQIRASNNLQFWTGSTLTERMRLTANGRLLLGTTSEQTYRLAVAGDVKFDADAATNGFYWDNTNKRLGIGTNAPVSSFQIGNGYTNLDYNNFRNTNNPEFLLSSNNVNTFVRIIGGDYGLASSANIDLGVPISKNKTVQNIGYRITSAVDSGAAINNGYLSISSLVGETAETFTPTERLRITSNGNLHLGTFVSDSGQRLQVTGDTLMKGSGNTSATTALTVQNSDANNLITVRNDNVINIGLRPAVSIYPAAFGAVQNITGRGIAMSFIASDTAYEPLTLTHGNFTTTANGYIVFNTIGTFNPTSGTATYTANRIGSTINQTGGANGITRGLYVNPTLTAAADWRSIEWSNNTGWGLYGAGTANNYLGGVLHIGTTNPSQGLRIGTAPTVATSSTLSVNVAIPNSVTTAYRGILTSIGLNSSGFTLPNLSHFEAVNDGTHTAGVVTNLYGFRENLGTYSATNNYGFYGNIASGTGRWNLYMNGTANNFVNGSLFVGSATPLGTEKFGVYGTNAGGAVLIRIYNTGTTTGTFASLNLSTQTGSGGTVASSQIASLATDAVGNNAITFSNSTAGTFSEKMRITPLGNLHIGTFSSDSGERLQVNGTMKVTGASTMAKVTIAATTDNFLQFNRTSTNPQYQTWYESNGTTRRGYFGYGTAASDDLTLLNEANGQLILGTNNVTRLTIATTGSATFTSSVTASSLISNGVGTFGSDITASGSGNITIKAVSSNNFPLFQLVDSRVGGGTWNIEGGRTLGNLQVRSGTGGQVLEIASTGAATFSSSVTSNGNMLIQKSQPQIQLYQTGADNNYSILGNTNVALEFWHGTFGSNTTKLLSLASGGAATFISSIEAATAIAIGTTPDTNKPFKILKNINATVGINFENTSTSSLAFSAIQMGTDVTGGTKFTNLVYGSSGISQSGVYHPDGTSLINNGGGGLNFLGTPTRFYTGGSNGVLRLLHDNEGTTQFTATTPTTNATDGYKQYSADVVAGNAAPHFRTENGAVIKLYQETTGVGNAIISLGGGSSVLDDTTFDGYTLRQIVKALRNQGILA